MARHGTFYAGLATAAIFVILEIAAMSMLKRSSPLQDIWINRFSHNVMAVTWGGVNRIQDYFGLREQNEILAGRNYELFKELQHYKEMEKALALNPESKEVASNLCLLSIQENKMTSVRNLLSRAEGSPTYNEVLGNVMIIDGRYSYATGLLSENTTNSSLLAHILNQEYGKAGSLLNAKPDKDGMTYYLQSLLGLRSGNDALLESGLKTLRRVAPRLYMRARQSSDFAACMDMFKSIEQ